MDATPLWWPPVDPETQRELVTFLTERGVDPDDIAKGIREDSLWELTTESLLATRDDLTADELGRRAGLTPEQLRRVLRALGLRDDSFSSDDVVVAATGAAAFKLFRDEEAALRLAGQGCADHPLRRVVASQPLQRPGNSASVRMSFSICWRPRVYQLSAGLIQRR